MTSLWSSFLILAAAGLMLGSGKPSQSTDREIARLEKEWAECFRAGNPKAAEQFIAEDFIGISSKASRYSKQEALKEISESKGVYRSFAATDITLRVYGETAIAQGKDGCLPREVRRKELRSGLIPGSSETASGRLSPRRTSSLLNQTQGEASFPMKTKYDVRD
jgi:hypothetical protein